jgi:plasmid stabilization system protein ParE
MEIIWSPRAKRNFDDLVSFLEQKWEKKVIIKLFEELESVLKLISKNPFLFPVISDKKQIRKCLVRRRTILLYAIHEDDDRIELILFVDGRVNPLKYKF